MSIPSQLETKQSEHPSVPSPSLSDDPGQEQPSLPTTWVNKYKYQQFDPYSPGERTLKNILRKILPQALFLTWEVLAQENQAPGNDAYLGVTKLAQARERTDRKVRMDLDDLQGRQLLSIRYEWKIFRQADGSIKARPVAIKDFERLYDLAYEYLQWTQSDCYIPPDREYADLIRENEPLYEKLRRFDNYRRVLRTQKPGREAQEKEIHRWYKDYKGATTLPLPSQDRQTQERAEEVQAVAENTTESIWKKQLKESLQEPLKKASIERIESIDNQNEQRGDSFDSAQSLEEREDAGADYTKSTLPNETISHEETPPTPTITQTNPTKQLPPFSGKGRAAARQQADLDPRMAAFLEQAMNAPQTEGAAGPIVRKKAADVTPNPLIERFVRTMSSVLGDESKDGQASVTRSLRAVKGKRLSQMDIVACLIMAYVVARDTKTINEKYRRPDRDLRMPLFCTMFCKFVGQRTQGEFNYNEKHLLQHIANDQELRKFFERCDLGEMQQAPAQASNANGKPLTTAPVVESSPSGAAAPRSGSDDMSQADAKELVGEILRDREALGVINAIPQGQKNGTYVVVVTTRKRSMPIRTAQTWRDIRHIVEGEAYATIQ